MNAAQILTSSLTATATSAWETLLVCDRQARKDTAKVQAWMASTEVQQARRRAWTACLWTVAIVHVLGAVMFVLGQEARAWVDRFVEESQVQPEPEPTVEEVVEVAIASLPALPLAGSLPVAEVVAWCPEPTPVPAPVAPVRRRGRPKGSKNRKPALVG